MRLPVYPNPPSSTPLSHSLSPWRYPGGPWAAQLRSGLENKGVQAGRTDVWTARRPHQPRPGLARAQAELTSSAGRAPAAAPAVGEGLAELGENDGCTLRGLIEGLRAFRRRCGS